MEELLPLLIGHERPEIGCFGKADKVDFVGLFNDAFDKIIGIWAQAEKHGAIVFGYQGNGDGLELVEGFFLSGVEVDELGEEYHGGDF